jgi:hypothetical protein
LRPAQANSSQDPISNITRAKWTVDVAQMVDLLFCKCEALSSNTNSTKKNYTFNNPKLYSLKL